MSNNAFGLGGRTFLSWAENSTRVDQRVIRGDTRVLRGIVTNVKDYHHLSQHYDVKIQDYKQIDGSDLILRACKRVVDQASFDGVGVFSPLEEGDPVLLQSPNGKLEDSVIIGAYYTIGNYTNYFREGQADKPFTVHPSEFTGTKTAAQPSNHPARVAQPDSYVHIVGGKNRQEPFTDPRYFPDKTGQRAASPQVASIEIKNKVGDIVQYSAGAQIYYSDAEILILTNADGSSRCKRLNDMAAYYVEMGKKIRAYLGLSTEGTTTPPSTEATTTALVGTNPTEAPTTGEEGLNISLNQSPIAIPSSTNTSEEDPTTISSPVKPSVVSYVEGLDTNRSDIASIDFNEWSPTTYHLDQVTKLAKLYRAAAESCVQSSLASAKISEALGEQKPLESTSVAHNPNEESHEVPECNYGLGRSESTYQRLVVIHETGESADSAISYIGNESSGVSYHAIVKRDGTISRLVSDSDTAYGAGCSSFPKISGTKVDCNEMSASVGSAEAVCLTPDERKESKYSQEGCTTLNYTTCSVNPFAVHYSLESGDGYTIAQYQSLAKLIKDSGVTSDRVTSHYNVDNSGTRQDPRGIDLSYLNKELARQGFSGSVDFPIVGTPIEPKE